MFDSYSNNFNTIEKAIDYDNQEYGSHSYSSLLWGIEKKLLLELISEFKLRNDHASIDYLDFACGTGRVLSFLEDYVDIATGIDCSEAMIILAKKRVCRSRVICADITLTDKATEGRYDIITAFRFILNAEPELRLTAMKCLVKRLKNANSWLIFNNHSNLLSIKLLMWPYYALKKRNDSHQLSGNYLTHTQVLELAEKAGLHIERVAGYGLLGGKIAKLLSFDKSQIIENWVKVIPFFSRIATNQLYVARLSDDI